MKFITFILKTLLDRVPITEQQNGITLVKVEGIRDLENFIEFNDLKDFSNARQQRRLQSWRSLNLIIVRYTSNSPNRENSVPFKTYSDSEKHKFFTSLVPIPFTSQHIIDPQAIDKAEP